MINVIIMDDNNTILEAMQNLIDWNSNGFNILALFKNGKEALNFIKATTENVDIVFTDMKMPLMDGITFIKEFKKLDIYAEIVVLSSYDDYPLVRESFTWGVRDYLLKSEFDPDSMLELCERLKQDIVKRKYQNVYATGNRIISQVQELIDNRLSENINLKSIADELQITSGYLGQLFMKYTSQNFNEYLNSKRIEKAMQLLLQENCKIYEVADECGYNNVEHFSRSFKRLTGKTPKEWQNSCESGGRGLPPAACSKKS